eukprot:CAMPEP_0117859394 /NCGR_PEP_ID=MMETSP0950-20121206/3111_1 /TAXON_ID=44440 /ORGANISM="Chattonella subsalsa, Strain CCMP2191" /LENGTH=202 /DNA_ID=CAMNT_0005709267 /DNA_START=64 /DNA_END=672 /DNA_ORIENTATION=+
MIKAVAFTALFSSAAAFLPAAPVAGSKNAGVVKMGLNDIIGADVETKGPWDPLNLAVLSEQSANNPDLKWLQEAEIKHGRVCMLAFVGILATKFGIHIPDYPVQTNDFTVAFGEMIEKNPFAFLQIIFSIALIEGQSYPGDLWFGKGREPGDLGFTPFGTKNFEKARLQEIKNGRAAMIGVMAFFSAAVLPGSVPIYDILGL